MKEPFTPERFWAQLDEFGPIKVDQLLASGRWGKVGPHFELAQKWREARVRAEQAAIDGRAAEAAERAAAAAERGVEIAERALATAKAANSRSTFALVLTGLTIFVTIAIAIFKPS